VLRRSGSILTVLGLLLLLAAAAVRFLLPGLAIRYPGGPLDTTLHSSGELTRYPDPTMVPPRAGPQVLPLSVSRRLRLVDAAGEQATVREDEQETVGDLPAQSFAQQYVLDRRALRGVADPRAFSYSVRNRVDRLGTFTVGLPFEAGAGPYPVWQNEVGRAYDVRRTGSSRVSGVRLSRYEGSLAGAAVQPAYVDALAAQAIAARLTPTQAATRFTTQGIDIAALRRLVLPRLTPDDRASAVAVLAAGIPLRFTLDASAAYLVEPRTGAVVGLDRVDETLFAAPDLSGLSRLGTLLSTPRYGKNGAVQRAARAIRAVVERPPMARVQHVVYAQTPASVADLVAFWGARGDRIDLVRRTVPLTLLLSGLLLLGVGVVLALVAGRRPTGRHAAPSGRPTGH